MAENDLLTLKAELASEALWKSYGEMASERGVNKAILWRIIHQDYEPRRSAIRSALGLPPLITLQTGPGVAITSGAMLMVSSSICPCGRSFIPNHPSRRWCTICRPARRR